MSSPDGYCTIGIGDLQGRSPIDAQKKEMGSAAHLLFLSHTLHSGKLVTISAIVRRAVAALITPITVSLALACLVHGNSTFAHRGAVQALDSRPSILIAHIDKAEAFAPSRLAVSDDCAK